MALFTAPYLGRATSCDWPLLPESPRCRVCSTEGQSINSVDRRSCVRVLSRRQYTAGWKASVTEKFAVDIGDGRAANTRRATAEFSSTAAR
jgi:hypothetical protein